MLICSCKGVSQQRVSEEIRRGHRSLRDLQIACQAGTDCGQCVEHLRKMLGGLSPSQNRDSGISIRAR